jgi:hypothetical protein
MERVIIRVPRGRRYASDVGFDVYGDGGSGSVDYGRPLNAQRVRLWPDAPPRAGHLREGYLIPEHLDSVSPEGHLGVRHLRDEHLWGGGEATFAAGPYCFGRLAHAVRMVDGRGEGDANSVTIVSSVVNSWPRRAGSFAVSAFDEGSDQVSFSFGPSPDVG